MLPTEPSSSRETRRGGAIGDDYLTRQIADARLALESTLDDLTFDMAKAAEVRRWIERYPWATLGVAVVAGFTAAHLFTSSRRRPDDEPTTKNTAAVENAHAAPLEHRREPTQEDRPSGEWRAAIVAGLFDILKLAVTQLVAASFRQASSRPVDGRQADGVQDSDGISQRPNVNADAPSGGDDGRNRAPRS
jgi:hypothetical protein